MTNREESSRWHPVTAGRFWGEVTKDGTTHHVQHIENRSPPNGLAGASRYASTYLARTFTECVGMPPIDDLEGMRLQHTQTTDLSVTTSDHAVRFSNNCYFAEPSRRAEPDAT